MNVALLTVSDRVSEGTTGDRSGPAMRDYVEARGDRVVEAACVADEAELISAWLIETAARPDVELILTSGGTGFAPRDVTPEATLAVLERQAPGIAEAMRAASAAHTPAAVLSRGVAGIRADTAVVNLPGNPKAVAECLDQVYEALRHGVNILAGRAEHPAHPSLDR